MKNDAKSKGSVCMDLSWVENERGVGGVVRVGYRDIISHKYWGLTQNCLGNSRFFRRILNFTENTLLLDSKSLLAIGIVYQ